MAFPPDRYYPKGGDNRLNNVGDISNARRDSLNRSSGNLRALLESRYEWMNTYIEADWNGLEIGCGAGFSRDYIRCNKLILTDYADYEHLDKPWVDAEALPYEDASFEFIIASNVLHHLPHPMMFFKEANRVLKPGGRILINESHASVLMCLILWLTRHEGYDFDVNVFDPTTQLSSPNEPWNGNNSIGRLLFDNPPEFEAQVPHWSVISNSLCELGLFLNSGGVTAKTFYLPLPDSLCRLVALIDALLIPWAPNILALGRRTVLEKEA